MATQSVSTDISGPGTRDTLDDSNGLWVSRTGLVGSTDGINASVYGSGSGHTVHVEGAVSGVYGVRLGNDSTWDSGNSVVIASTGVVYGTSYAVAIHGGNARLDNFGLIHGGVYIESQGLAMSRIFNGGDIISRYDAVVHQGSESMKLLNTGTIFSNSNAFVSTDATAIDLIRNQGEIFGRIFLGGGDDLYDGRGGFVDGTVSGQDGNDTFRAGSGIEVFDGGTGIDTLDCRSTAGVTVYLDGSRPNTGTAEGDDHIRIENVQGSVRGATGWGGNADNNFLRGFGGADTLSGGFGADSLAGGTGNDLLIGSEGDDIFVFEAADDAGDVIGDYGQVSGDNDSFQFSAAGFGGGLTAGGLSKTQFQSRADNVAQNGDVRFIFRTTDQTLWFDSNGNGAGGLLMVADLQSGAVVTSGDIFLI